MAHRRHFSGKTLELSDSAIINTCQGAVTDDNWPGPGKTMSAQAEQAAVEMNKERVAAARSAAPDTVRDAVIRAVAAWEGVTIHNHRFGGVEFRLGRRELGHLHATFADLPFPKVIRDELIAAGRARPHHVLPESGWVTAPMRDPAEATGIIRLFRQNYERAAGLHR